jgi:hypothetical protein
MNYEQKLQKALLLLDRGRQAEAEVELRLVDANASDDLTRTRSRAVLGELLWLQARDAEAVVLLESVLSVERDDDLLSYERDRADELLRAIRGGA